MRALRQTQTLTSSLTGYPAKSSSNVPTNSIYLDHHNSCQSASSVPPNYISLTIWITDPTGSNLNNSQSSAFFFFSNVNLHIHLIILTSSRLPCCHVSFVFLKWFLIVCLVFWDSCHSHSFNSVTQTLYYYIILLLLSSTWPHLNSDVGLEEGNINRTVSVL